ncbi:hypothetical protein Rruber_05610 (plasmid) [Rhodococcus ruber]
MLLQRTAKCIVDRCVQLHGGYGYTMEYPAGGVYIDTGIHTNSPTPARDTRR